MTAPRHLWLVADAATAAPLSDLLAEMPMANRFHVSSRSTLVYLLTLAGLSVVVVHAEHPGAVAEIATWLADNPRLAAGTPARLVAVSPFPPPLDADILAEAGVAVRRLLDPTGAPGAPAPVLRGGATVAPGAGL